ncbi:MAG: hypothetical protein EXQ47_09655 [Bryobacterales bacterium]|nr:hypothetical protein [Bryobacterales bacterium]
MKRTRQIQYFKRSLRGWDAPRIVHDFRWEDPDIVILDAEGKEIERVRVGAGEEYQGWLGGTVWIPEDPSPR